VKLIGWRCVSDQGGGSSKNEDRCRSCVALVMAWLLGLVLGSELRLGVVFALVLG
jgi:hypothetical protein